MVTADGRIKRGVVFLGTILNMMDLSNFPFDTSEIELDLHTSSHYRCLDSSRKNMLTLTLTTGRGYTRCTRSPTRMKVPTRMTPSAGLRATTRAGFPIGI